MYLVPVAKYGKEYAEYCYNKERHIEVSGIAREQFVKDKYAYHAGKRKSAANEILFQHRKEYRYYVAYNGENHPEYQYTHN